MLFTFCRFSSCPIFEIFAKKFEGLGNSMVPGRKAFCMLFQPHSVAVQCAENSPESLLHGFEARRKLHTCSTTHKMCTIFIEVFSPKKK